jgi:carboxyl-terminal processing protease
MRGLSAWCGCLLAAALAAYALRAAPAPSPEPAGTHAPPNPALRAEARDYAGRLTEVVDRIGIEYVRPVSRADLAVAALTGLYEAARQPVPPGLKQEVQQFADSDLVGLLARAREELGPNDALRGSTRALIVSVQALPKALDPYCGLIIPQESQRLDSYESTPNVGLEFAGIAPPPTLTVFGGPGARIQGEVVIHDRPAAPTGPVRVQSVVPGGPGQRAGIRPDDLIVKIDGRPADSAAFPALFRRLEPIRPGMPYDPANASPSRLTILRPGRPEPIEVAIAPVAFRPESVFGARRRPDGSWDFLLDPAARVGYVRLGAIGLATHTEFFEALKSLTNQSIRGLVLDLRWCPGGYLAQATTIAHLLLPGDAPVANQKERGSPVKSVPFDDLGATYTDFPVVALVNGETSGGGELIAAALQDHGRAVIAGQRTVGKGSVQKPLERSPVPFKLTTGMFLRPSGKNLQRHPDSKPSDDWGIRPDAGRDIPLTAEASRRLKAWWLLSTLRPAGSTEALPLDDPENDPQRQAAVQMLRGVMK